MLPLFRLGKLSAGSAVGVFALALALLLPSAASAQIDTGLGAAQAIGLSTLDVRTIVGTIINAFFGLVGFILVALIMYAGFQWMTAQGDPTKVDAAKATLRNAVIGFIIMMLAYAITAFIFNAITGSSLIGGGGRGTGQPPGGVSSFALSGRASDALGSGVIEYHYPEPAQRDVPRNARVSVTFKKPLVLSTVLLNYDDKGTPDVVDDRICAPDCAASGHSEAPVTADTVLTLNTANVKIIPLERLSAPSGGDVGSQFDSRHAGALGDAPDPAPQVKVTAVPADGVGQQTIVIIPQLPLGSPSAELDYRVALRGGERGVAVWSVEAGGTPSARAAFARATPDGGYQWSFATSTTLDTAPPKISSVVPTTARDLTSASAEIDRNQLLQITFNEAVDPTVASGVIGAGGGLTAIQVQARCAPGASPASCDAPFNTDQFVSVAGSVAIGNRYRTVEFTPSTPCEGVARNSCGEEVFCLPKNAELRVAAISASVGADAPRASANDGILDMAGNSLDGNGNGTAEGPVSASRPRTFSLNGATQFLDAVSDSAEASYRAGDRLDLEPPFVVATDPRSPPPEDAVYAASKGPSEVPADLPIAVTWSETMSISSLRTGGPSDAEATVVLQARECRKKGPGEQCERPVDSSCPPDTCPADPPAFFLDVGETTVAGRQATLLSILHRAFFTADQLGYTEEEAAAGDVVPRYAPVLRAKVRDGRQNCFSPSRSVECGPADAGKTSCCDKTSVGDGAFAAVCGP